MRKPGFLKIAFLLVVAAAFALAVRVIALAATATSAVGDSSVQTSSVVPAAESSADEASSTTDVTAEADESETVGTASDPSLETLSTDVSEGTYFLTIRMDVGLEVLDAGQSALLSTASAREASQRFLITGADGYATIKSSSTGQCLTLIGGSGSYSVGLADASSTDDQLWAISKGADDTYAIVSKLTDSGKALTLTVDTSDGSGVLEVVDGVMTSASAGQGWRLTSLGETLDSGIYSISMSYGMRGCLTIANADPSASAQAQVCSSESVDSQRFTVTYDKASGYYSILNVETGMYLQAPDTPSDGSTVGQGSANGNATNPRNQLWDIVPDLGRSGFLIVSASCGKALSVSSGGLSSGEDAQLWTVNGEDSQAWTFSSSAKVDTSISIPEGDYVIACAGNVAFSMDVTDGGLADGTNIQVFARNGTGSQTFHIVPTGDGWYSIANISSGKYVTKAANKDVGIVSGGPGPSSSQLWKPVRTPYGISFVCKADATLAIGLASSTYSSGVNVNVAIASPGVVGQSFVLVSAGAPASVSIAGFYSIDNVTGSRLESRDVSGTQTIYLSSASDVSKYVFGCYVTPECDGLLVSGTSDGEYSPVGNGGTIDLGQVATRSDGDYVLYAKASADAEPTKLVVMRSSGIATMCITSADPVGQGERYVDSSTDHSASADVTAVLYDADGKVVNDNSKSQAATIKGHGNSTWISSSKKPYQLKLGMKCDLLSNGSAAKKWLLLANSADASLLHDLLAYKLALQMGLAYSVDCEPVDVYYDGTYLGSYLLSSKVEVGKSAVNISDLEDSNEKATKAATGDDSLDSYDTAIGYYTHNGVSYAYQYVTGVVNPGDISGGYLVELDDAYFRSERSWFETPYGDFVIKTPENASKEEVAYIAEKFANAFDHLYSGTGISSYFDLDSLAKCYVLNEYTKNIDYLASSTFYYVYSDSEVAADSTRASFDGTSLIYSGPNWDFDTGFGTRDIVLGSNYAGLFTVRYRYLYPKGEEYQNAVKSYYQDQFSSIINGILLGDEDSKGTYLNSLKYYRSLIFSSERMNESVWGLSTFPNCIPALPSYEMTLDSLVNFLTWRNAWMSQEVATWNGSQLTNDAVEYDGFDYEYVFDASYYLSAYPDLRSSFGDDDQTALRHFVEYGMAEGRQASLNFNVFHYKARYADLSAAFGDDLPAYYRHFCEYGFKEGRSGI